MCCACMYCEVPLGVRRGERRDDEDVRLEWDRPVPAAGVSERYGIFSRSANGSVASAEFEKTEPMTATTSAPFSSLNASTDWSGWVWSSRVDELDLAAEQPALRVDLLDGELDGLLVLAAERGEVAGQRGDEPHLDGALVGCPSGASRWHRRSSASATTALRADGLRPRARGAWLQNPWTQCRLKTFD